MKNSDYLTMLYDRLKPLGPVSLRAARGGHGFFMRELLFGLVMFDQLYFKINAQNAPTYKAAGASPFIYPGRHRKESLSFWSVPEKIIAQPTLLRDWATASIKAVEEEGVHA